MCTILGIRLSIPIILIRNEVNTFNLILQHTVPYGAHHFTLLVM